MFCRAIEDDGISSRLTAAKPVSWRGRGDLIQMTWAQPPKGTFLVIELWAGVSGLAVAMLALGMTFYGAAAEMDPVASECAAKAAIGPLPQGRGHFSSSLQRLAGQEETPSSDFRGRQPMSG